MTENDQEQVVLTPKAKTENSTVLIIERRKIQRTNDKMHIAGGQHTGIIINKETENRETGSPDLSLEFRVYLVNKETTKHTQEARTLRFWFRNIHNGHNETGEISATTAQDFFKELVSPQEFPRDYVGFIKKIMKLMQHNYKSIDKIEVELKQLKDVIDIPSTPYSAEEHILGHSVALTIEKVLEIIESSYPNPITIKEIAKNNNWDEEEVSHCLSALQSRQLVKAMDHGAFTRQQSYDAHQVQIVKQMPTMVSAKQPTIAIITALYCEKLAVDAMIENKETYVRYTTVGESNVYTLGNIGAHRIVCTKLPTVGHTREAMTAAGNTTTRLLGTFQKVDYVFLVGVGGGIPHYTDYNKHVRLGDVVVSYPGKNKNIYLYCENALSTEDGVSFEIKPYSPNNTKLQEIAANLKNCYEKDSTGNTVVPPWLNYIKDGLSILGGQQEQDFRSPSTDTDKLYMSIGDRELIEVAHPEPQEKDKYKRLPGCPRIHLAPIASGRHVVKDDRLRQQVAAQIGALAFDSEFDAVIESIVGNCKDSFICIRGISDYKDGTRHKEWQPYAALAAATVMKAIICGMEDPVNL